MVIRSRIPPIPILTPPAFSLPKGKGFTKMGNLDSLYTVSVVQRSTGQKRQGEVPTTISVIFIRQSLHGCKLLLLSRNI
ncbi:hypothetical protein PROFUN_16247 [Planoprotostelium fungivorum]|uniref:Uncharacterized protein n=1 Tax=Planoprotostelium fungivorum TaxID=1890364 RepID=A0A2P6MRB7_9EUKA|nr:hypothetical protein PROFUN_16247 [Planoprotostelium fungivorum]